MSTPRATRFRPDERGDPAAARGPQDARTSRRDDVVGGATPPPVDPSRLAPVAQPLPLGAYLRETWRNRWLIWTMSVVALRSSNSRDRFGSAWLVLTPLTLAAVYFLAFGLLLDTRQGVDNYVGFLIVGVFLFQYSARIINEGTKSVTGGRRLIRAFPFPRLVLPLAIVLRLFLGFLPALAVMLAIAWVTVPRENVTWRWLLVLPTLLLLTAFCVGIVLVLARTAAAVNDVVNLVPFAVRGWMYFSGVFYAVERFAENPFARTVLEGNPMHIYLTLARDSVLYGAAPSPSDWAGGLAWALPVLAVGTVVFWRGEASYARG